MDKIEKAPDAYRTISEVSDQLDVPQHVLRFWETKFPQVAPMKRAGNRRYYNPDHIGLLTQIRDLLYVEGYTTKGVQKLLEEGRLSESGVTGGDPAGAPRPAPSSNLLDLTNSVEQAAVAAGQGAHAVSPSSAGTQESAHASPHTAPQAVASSVTSPMLHDLAARLQATRDRLKKALEA